VRVCRHCDIVARLPLGPSLYVPSSTPACRCGVRAQAANWRTRSRRHIRLRAGHPMHIASHLPTQHRTVRRSCPHDVPDKMPVPECCLGGLTPT